MYNKYLRGRLECTIDRSIIVYLTLRVLKAVQAHDIELIHKYLGTRLSFASKILGAILVAK